VDITIEQAAKVLDTVDAGLCSGIGVPTPGQMCVEAAVCYGLGLPHGDDPACVSMAVRTFKIVLNDKKWTSPRARAKGLRKVAIAQLGSYGHIDDDKFVMRLVELTIRQIVPIAMRALLGAASLSAHHAAIRAVADRCEREGSREAAMAARKIGRAAADAADAADAAAAADAAYAAARAADAAAYAAYAAYAADAAADAAAARRDEILGISADLAVQVLRELNCPGIKLMDKLIRN
jgi:hypothetical protein